MPIAVSTKASHYPITLEEAKEHLRVTDTNSDSYIQGLIGVVTERAQGITGQSFITTEYTWKQDGFPCDGPLYVPMPPLQSVSSITYTDLDETTTTWSSSSYVVDTISKPGRIVPAYQETWPVNLNVMNSVTVTYTAGFGSHPGAVPESIKHAMKLMIGHNWANRQDVVVGSGFTAAVEVPQASMDLLAMYQVPFFEGY